MIQSFDYRGSPARILFAPGAIGRTAELMDALGCARALVVVSCCSNCEEKRSRGSWQATTRS